MPEGADGKEVEQRPSPLGQSDTVDDPFEDDETGVPGGAADTGVPDATTGATPVAASAEGAEIVGIALPTRVLVVVAHPDDVDFGAAGTIATWTEKGASVSYCIVTDGAAGLADSAIEFGGLKDLREEEQRAAAAVVGVTDVTFLGYPDGRLVPSMELRRDLTREIRRVRPEVVLCPSPERNYARIRASHPDHLAAGEAALGAVYPDSRNPYVYPELIEEEGLEPHEVQEVWMMAGRSADRFIDISNHVDAKIRALSCHRSQITNPDQLSTMIRGWGSRTALEGGLGPGVIAEAFQVVDTR